MRTSLTGSALNVGNSLTTFDESQKSYSTRKSAFRSRRVNLSRVWTRSYQCFVYSVREGGRYCRLSTAATADCGTGRRRRRTRRTRGARRVPREKWRASMPLIGRRCHRKSRRRTERSSKLDYRRHVKSQEISVLLADFLLCSGGALPN